MNYSRISSHGLFSHRSYLSLLVLAMLTLVSCSTPYNVTYFQDMPIEKRVPIVKFGLAFLTDCNLKGAVQSSCFYFIPTPPPKFKTRRTLNDRRNK